jgi:hypothetical protein
MAKINGTEQDDVIIGGAGNDRINAGDGNDTIDAGDGDNRIDAGKGDDTITAGSGDDRINAGKGDDVIDAGDGDNRINAGKGDDTITAGSGDDRINAGKGDDVIDAGDGDNRIDAGKGDDTINAGSGDDRINAGKGDDVIDAGDGDNRVQAGDGNDTIVTGSGDDRISAGDGDDLVNAGGGSDRVTLGDGDDLLIHVVALNAQEENVYHGGDGFDTLRLVLDADEAKTDAILLDLDALAQALSSGAGSYQFQSFDLKITGFEQLAIFAPVEAVDDFVSTSENEPVIFSVIGNDIDLLADGSALHLISIDSSGVPGGSLTVNADDTISFDPGTDFDHLAAGESLSFTFTYVVGDDQGYTDVGSVTLTVTGTNDTPTVSATGATGLTEAVDASAQDLSDAGTVSFDDLDATDVVDITFAANGDIAWSNGTLDPALAAALVAGFSTGATDADAPGSVPWAYSATADLDFLAEGETITFSYTVTATDSQGATAVDTVSFTVAGSNDAPTVLDALGATNQGQQLSGTLTASDADQSDTLTYVLASGPSNGSVQIGTDGTYIYTPARGFQGADSFSFTVTDGVSGSVEGTIAIEVAGTGIAGGQVRYLGDIIVDEQVSTATASKDNADVASLVGGGHVVVWSSLSQTPDGGGWGVFAQRYDAAGEKVGGEFLVNTTTGSDQLEPSVAAITGGALDGGFVVVWQSLNQDGSGWGVYAQRYDAGGAKVGGETLVNATTDNNQLYPAVAGLADGAYAVVWTDSNGTDREDVLLRVFNADGSPATEEVQVNQTTALAQRNEDWVSETITTLEDGRFVVTWTDYSDGSGWGVFARIFNADGSPATSEFQVNATISGFQQYGSVGALADGGFVVTWSDLSNADGSGWGVVAQRYDADGDAVGGEFLVNSFVGSNQIHSKVVGLSDGGFAIVWRSNGADGSNTGISGQRYAADGEAVGGEFIVNGATISNQDQPTIDLRADGALIVAWTADGNRVEQKIITDFEAQTEPVLGDEVVGSAATSKDSADVAALVGGGHVVVWSSFGQAPDGSGYGVYAQRYDAAGEKVGGEFLVNTTTPGGQQDPSVAAITGGALDGGFVVVWQSLNQDGSGWGVYAQRYDAGGAKVGGETLVNATTDNNQLYPAVAGLADGAYAVVWTDSNGTDREDVLLRVFNADGSPATEEVQVNQITAGTQVNEDWVAETITTLEDGRFVVTWTDRSGADGSGSGVFARIFDADGSPATNEFQVNSTASGSQQYGSVGALADGGFVVTWSDLSNADGSGWGVVAQRYDADGDAVGGEFLVNSFVGSNQIHSKVVGLSDGGFAIVWRSNGADGSNTGISGQRYAADGEAVGGEFIVNGATISNQDQPTIDLRADGALIVAWTADGNRVEQKIITDFEAQTEPVLGDEVVGSAATSKDSADVAALVGGGHVVVWSSFGQAPDGSGYGVYAQRYDAAGEKVGGEFLVNTTTHGHQQEPSVAAITGGALDGGFVVVWQLLEFSGSKGGVYAQRYDAGGAKVGGETLVKATTDNNQLSPAVTGLADGTYVVVWTDTVGADFEDVVLRVFNADGSPATEEMQVNQTAAGAQQNDDWVAETITTLADGRFVVTWTDRSGADGSGWGVFARVFNADGSPATNEFQVNSTASGSQQYGSVGALADGGFVVTWSDLSNADGSGWGVVAQRYDTNGDAVGGEFVVNSFAGNGQYASKVVGLSDGGFVVVWQSDWADGSNTGISGQRYAANGDAFGGEFIVNGATISSQAQPTIDLRDDGALIVAWVAGGNRIEQKIITDFGSEGASAKTLVGSEGNDSFIGSDLDDTLIGNGGDDLLTGLLGNDTFVFAPGFANDVVTDFAPGAGSGDVLRFEGGLFTDAADVLANAVQDGADVVITDPNDGSSSVRLKNVLLGNLHQDDFLIV